MKAVTRQVEVLIADRDSNIRSALRLMLINARNNILVTEVANTDNLNQLMRYGTFDLAIVDWDYARPEAPKFIKQLLISKHDFIVIVLSKRLEDKKAALALGAHAFIYKGDNPEQLRTTLLQYLDMAAQQLSQTPPVVPLCSQPIFHHYLI